MGPLPWLGIVSHWVNHWRHLVDTIDPNRWTYCHTCLNLTGCPNRMQLLGIPTSDNYVGVLTCRVYIPLEGRGWVSSLDGYGRELRRNIWDLSEISLVKKSEKQKNPSLKYLKIWWPTSNINHHLCVYMHPPCCDMAPAMMIFGKVSSAQLQVDMNKNMCFMFHI